MTDIRKALVHLEDAEAAILSWWQRMEENAEDEEIDMPFSSMLGAVLRSVARAVGVLEADDRSGSIRLTETGQARAEALIAKWGLPPIDDPNFMEALSQIPDTDVDD